MPTKLMVGLYAQEHDILEATRAVRARGIAIHDVYTPYPIHGMDDAMGIPPTRLGWVCFALGMTGVAVALFFQTWTFVSDWPMNVGGKSFWATPAILPVTFEVGVLLAALGTVLTLLIRTRLHPIKRVPLLVTEALDDRFALAVIPSERPLAEVRDVLKQHHATEIREVEV